MSYDIGKGRRLGSAKLEITAEDYHRLQRKLIPYLLAQGAFPEEARDLFQRAMLKAHQALGNFKGDSQFDTWFTTILKRVWLQERRAGKTLKRDGQTTPLAVSGQEEEANRGGVEPLAPSPDPESRAIRRDLLSHATRAIKLLPLEMHHAFCLYVHGHKYREIADLLRIPENRVASLIYQAREKIRKEIE
jgi:RNA polymerase sigma factor (sigma-70 family)